MFKLLVTICAVLSILANAAISEPLSVSMEAFQVSITEMGKETLLSAETASPGDVILYRAKFENTGDSVLSALNPKIPIPDSLIYLEGTSKPLPSLVVLSNGKTMEYPAVDPESGLAISLSDYRGLVWKLESLKPGESRLFELRVQVPKE